MPADNLVSVLARVHRIRGMRAVASTVDEALRVMRGPKREEPQEVFFRWMGKLGAHLGLDLGFLEDKQMREQLAATGKVRLAVEQRLRAQLDRMKARSLEQGLERGRKEGREEGLERERELLRRLTATRFGADTAENLEPLLVGIKDPKRLSSVSDWIMDCATGSQLLAKLRIAD